MLKYTQYLEADIFNLSNYSVQDIWWHSVYISVEYLHSMQDALSLSPSALTKVITVSESEVGSRKRSIREQGMHVFPIHKKSMKKGVLKFFLF